MQATIRRKEDSVEGGGPAPLAGAFCSSNAHWGGKTGHIHGRFSGPHRCGDKPLIAIFDTARGANAGNAPCIAQMERRPKDWLQSLKAGPPSPGATEPLSPTGGAQTSLTKTVQGKDRRRTVGLPWWPSLDNASSWVLFWPRAGAYTPDFGRRFRRTSFSRPGTFTRFERLGYRS